MSDGVRLSASYLPSRNGAAVVVLHGAASTRSSVLGHAVVLARHGFGCCFSTTRGHGRSAGDAMDFGWYGNRDIFAAVSYLEGRPDVRDGRIAAVGMSVGGEQPIAAAGSDPRIRAVVSECVTGMQPADHGWLTRFGVLGSIQRGIDWVTYGASAILSGAPRPMSLRESLRPAAPRPVMLIAAGRVADESIAGHFFMAASPTTAELWVVPGAAHTDGLAAQPAEWEARVTASSIEPRVVMKGRTSAIESPVWRSRGFGVLWPLRHVRPSTKLGTVEERPGRYWFRARGFS
jgi:uncharacterized protein